MTASDVLIVVGPAESPVRKIDLAAVGFGIEAAQRLGGGVDLLLMGPEAAAAAPAFAELEIRKIIVLEHADLNDYTAEAYSSALAQFTGRGNYQIIGGATSSASRDYFPRVAARLDIPMAP